MASETIKQLHEIYHTVVSVTTDNNNGRTITIQDDHILMTSYVIVTEKYTSGNAIGWFFVLSGVASGVARFYVKKYDGTWPDVNTPITLNVLIVN